MHITLSPVRSDAPLAVEKRGDTLVINGQTFDFTPLPEGATLPAEAIDCQLVIDSVHRIDGVLHLTLILPHGAGANEAMRFPAPIINPADGPLELPQ